MVRAQIIWSNIRIVGYMIESEVPVNSTYNLSNVQGVIEHGTKIILFKIKAYKKFLIRFIFI